MHADEDIRLWPCKAEQRARYLFMCSDSIVEVGELLKRRGSQPGSWDSLFSSTCIPDDHMDQLLCENESVPETETATFSKFN